MGFIDSLRNLARGRTTTDKVMQEHMRDFDINEGLAQRYGLQATKKQFVEVGSRKTSTLGINHFTPDTNDLLLEKYAKETGDDVQARLMKKYLYMSQADVYQRMIEMDQMETQAINNEVDETLQGVDEKTRAEVKRQMQKEDKVQAASEKKDMKTVILETTYKSMYRDYSARVLQIKAGQFNQGEITISTEQAMEIMAMEKNLESLEFQYHKHAKADITKLKPIKDSQEEFKRKFSYNQKGIEAEFQIAAQKINRLYQVREEKYRDYINALKNPNKSGAEIAMYKKEYQEANLELANSVPSLERYREQMRDQVELEDKAKVRGREDSAVVMGAKTGTLGNTDVTVSESEIAEDLDYVEASTLNDSLRSETLAHEAREDALRRQDESAAIEITHAETAKIITDNEVEGPTPTNASRVEEEIKREQSKDNASYMNSLRGGVTTMDEVEEEELQKIADGKEISSPEESQRDANAIEKAAEDSGKEEALRDEIRRQAHENEDLERQRVRKNNGNNY